MALCILLQTFDLKNKPVWIFQEAWMEDRWLLIRYDVEPGGKTCIRWTHPGVAALADPLSAG